MISAAESLERLLEGNRRFVVDSTDSSTLTGQARRHELVAGQTPHAVILGCADSRVPAELVFDQSLGDLFVVRVAGNIAAESQMGSVEFAVENLGSRLVVVLGHSGCGAIQATLNLLAEPSEVESPNLRSITDRIRRAIQPLADAGQLAGDDLLEAAVRTNIRAAVAQLRTESGTLNRFQRDHGLCVVGAEYDLHTGCVDFFETGGIQ